MSALAPVLLCLASGCVTLPGGITPPWKKADTAEKKIDAPKDQLTLTAGGMKREVIDSGAVKDLEGAKRLYANKQFSEAEPIFHKLAHMHPEPHWWEVGVLAPKDDKEPVDDSGNKVLRVGNKHRSRGLNPVAEESLFMEAECQRMQKNYRTAVDTYMLLLTEAPRSRFTPQTCQGLFEIADFWLEGTRRQMDEYQEQLKGKRWFVTPAMYVSFNKEYPMLDTEGHAIILLNTIRLHDIKGPLGEKSLLYLGTINFFRQDYKEADFYFTQLGKEYKDGPYAAKAIKQSVICKQLMTGGSVYDCRGVEESKKLLMQAQGAYPELAKDEEWIRLQLTSINIQQADRDLKVAEFYRRTGHPGSAYFYYELVCRRYPNTDYADKAEKRKSELKAAANKDHLPDAPPTPPRPNPEMRHPDGFVAPPPRTLPSFEPK